MAAIGSFGRTRRNGGGNLSSIIASLYRQQQEQRDHNIFDAWQNGGEFEGKPVTDKRILEYIKGRRNGFDKADPLWDQWNDTLTQTRFSIGEQDITTRYKQGKASAGDVAAFYKHQLNGIPKHSAFYRTVSGRAADWAKQAASAARGAARSRANAALQDSLGKAARGANIYDAVTKAITEAAHKAGLIIGSRASFADANAASLIDFVNNLGMTVNGHHVTFEYWQELGRRKAGSLDKQIAIRKQAGLSTKSLRSQRSSFVSGELSDLNALDDRSQYETLHQQFEDDLRDAQNDPSKQIEATNRYLAGLKGLLGKSSKGGARNAPTDDFVGALRNEIESIQTGKVIGRSAWDIFENGTAGESTRTDDLTGTVEGLWGSEDGKDAGAIANRDGIANGTMYYGQDQYGASFGVHPVDPAKGLGQDQTISVINIDGTAEQVVLTGKPVEAANYVDSDGNPVDVSSLSAEELQGKLFRGEIHKDNTLNIGFIYTNPNQPTKPIYGSYDSNGTLHFTTTNPFAGTVAPDGSYIAGTDENGHLDPTTVINPDVQGTGRGVAIDDNATSNDLINIGEKVIKGGNVELGNAIYAAGVAKQPTTHLDQLIAANTSPDEYGTPLQQTENRNAAEAADREANPFSLGGVQTYANPTPKVGPAARYQAQFPTTQPPINPKPPVSASQPQIKAPPQINIPAPPPVVTITPDDGMGSAIGFKTGSKPKTKAQKPPKIKYQNNSGPSQGKGYY